MPINHKFVEKVLKPGTIGNLEALAGIDSDKKSRFAFWLECAAEARRRFNVATESGEQVFSVARERCHKAIARRVNAGEVSLCR